jgi:hypothetical protein
MCIFFSWESVLAKYLTHYKTSLDSTDGRRRVGRSLGLSGYVAVWIIRHAPLARVILIALVIRIAFYKLACVGSLDRHFRVTRVNSVSRVIRGSRLSRVMLVRWNHRSHFVNEIICVIWVCRPRMKFRCVDQLGNASWDHILIRNPKLDGF